YFLIPKNKINRREIRFKRINIIIIFFILILFSTNIFSLPETNFEINSSTFDSIFKIPEKIDIITTPINLYTNYILPIDLSYDSEYISYNFNQDSNIGFFEINQKDVFLLNNLKKELISKENYCYNLILFLEDNPINSINDLLLRTEDSLKTKVSKECFYYLKEKKVISSFPLLLDISFRRNSNFDKSYNYKENIELNISTNSIFSKNFLIDISILNLNNQYINIYNYYDNSLDFLGFSINKIYKYFDISNFDEIYNYRFNSSNVKIISENNISSPIIFYKNKNIHFNDKFLYLDYNFSNNIFYINYLSYYDNFYFSNKFKVFTFDKIIPQNSKNTFYFSKDKTYFKLKKDNHKSYIELRGGIPFLLNKSDIAYFYTISDNLYYNFITSQEDVYLYIFDARDPLEFKISWFILDFSSQEYFFNGLNNFSREFSIISVSKTQDDSLLFLLDLNGEIVEILENTYKIYENYLIVCDFEKINVYLLDDFISKDNPNYNPNLLNKIDLIEDINYNISQEHINHIYFDYFKKDKDLLKKFNTMIFDISNSFDLNFEDISVFWALSYSLSNFSGDNFSTFIDYNYFCSSENISQRYNDFEPFLSSANFKYFKYNFFDIKTNQDSINYFSEITGNSNNFTQENYVSFCNMVIEEDVSNKNFASNIFLLLDLLNTNSKDQSFFLEKNLTPSKVVLDLGKYSFKDFYENYIAFQNIFLDLEKISEYDEKYFFKEGLIDVYYDSNLDFRILPLKYDYEKTINNFLNLQNKKYIGNCSYLSADSLNKIMSISKSDKYFPTVDAWYRIVDSSSVSVWFEGDDDLNLNRLLPGMILGIRINNNKKYIYNDDFVNPDWFDIPQKYKQLGYYSYNLEEKSLIVPYTHVVSYIGDYKNLHNQILNSGDFEINLTSIFDYVPIIKEKDWISTKIVEVFLPSNYYDEEELENIKKYITS
ncbi:MAG: hypothetical protein PHR26_02020, partial [Candidatus ainarchaeum sp.]|nr:hypothetical protein [Candidatus ainarchaeum sp.]